MNYRTIPVPALAMICACLLLASCGSTPRSAVEPAESVLTQQPQATQFPSLPSPQQLLNSPDAHQPPVDRQANFVAFADGEREGGDYAPSLANALVSQGGDPSVAIFSPSWTSSGGGQAAYCIYPLQFPTYNADPMKLRLKWQSAAQKGNVYVALSNWQTNRWDWHEGPWFKSQTPDLGDITPYLKPATGLMFLVVLTLGEDELLLEKLNLFTQLPPVAKLQSSAQSGQVPASINFGAGQSSDPDGTIADIQWDLNGNGIFNEPGPEADQQGDSGPVQVNYTIAGEFQVGLRVYDDYGDSSEQTRTMYISDSPPPVADLQADVTTGSTPLAVTFNASASMDPDGTIDDYEWDFDGDGTYNEPGNGEEAGRGDPTPDSVSYPDPGSFEASVRVTDNDGNVDIAAIDIEPFNGEPTAVLSASVSEGAYPLTVRFDASASTDPDDNIANYEWDLDGDGIFSEAGSTPPEQVDPWGNPVISFPILETVIYQEITDINVSVRVTDEEGSSDIASVPLFVGPWQDSPVSAAGAGNNADLMEIDGRPAVSYFDRDNFQLMYAINDTPLGGEMTNWTGVAIEGIGDDDGYLSGKTRLRVVDGNPAIAYLNGNHDELRYLRSSSVDGDSAADWHSSGVLDTGNFCRYPDFEVLDGKPAITYQNNSELMMIRATDTQGMNWMTPVSLGPGGYASDLKDIDGLANIFNWKLLPEDGLEFYHFTDDSGFDVLDGLRLDADGYTRSTRLLESGGLPILVGYNMPGSYYSIQFSSTADGGQLSDWSGEVVMTEGNLAFSQMDALMYEGAPLIVYRTGLNDIWYAHATTYAGPAPGSLSTHWMWNTMIAEDVGNTFEISLAIINDVPAVIYFNPDDDQLRYAVKIPQSDGS